MSVGDIIKIECILTQNKVRFLNETNPSEVVIDVDFNKYEDMHPFIFLHKQGDSIELILDKDQLKMFDE